MQQIKKKLCFVVGPIGESDSESRIHADWLLEEIIQPVFEKHPEYEVVRADKISQPGMIDAQVIQHLLDADLVIADLSGENPNAFYEIGIRHMIQKPIIHVQLVGQKIPFDVSLYRAVKFARTRPSDIRKAREDLATAVAAVMAPDHKVENPVTRARGQIQLEVRATPEEKVVLNKLKSIEDRIQELENSSMPNVAKEVIAPRQVPTRRSKPPPSIELFVHLDDGAPHSVYDQVAQKLMAVEGVQSITSSASGMVRFVVPRNFVDTIQYHALERSLREIPSVRELSEIPF